MFLAGWGVGHLPYNKLVQDYEEAYSLIESLTNDFNLLNTKYNNLMDEYAIVKDEYETVKSELEAIHEESEKPKSKGDYLHRLQFDTVDTAAISFTIAKGEMFEALVASNDPIVFWIYDPTWQKIVDAGLVDTYNVSFIAEESGTYIFVFDDKGHKTTVSFFNNSSSVKTDASVRR